MSVSPSTQAVMQEQVMQVIQQVAIATQTSVAAVTNRYGEAICRLIVAGVTTAQAVRVLTVAFELNLGSGAIIDWLAAHVVAKESPGLTAEEAGKVAQLLCERRPLGTTQTEVGDSIAAIAREAGVKFKPLEPPKGFQV